MPDPVSPSPPAPAPAPVPRVAVELVLPRSFEVRSIDFDVPAGKVTVTPLPRRSRTAMPIAHLVVRAGDGQLVYECKLSPSGQLTLSRLTDQEGDESGEAGV